MARGSSPESAPPAPPAAGYTARATADPTVAPPAAPLVGANAHTEAGGAGGPLEARAWWRPALGVGTLLIVLALWELASRTRVLNPQFFPPVTDILGTFVALWQNNVFPPHLAATLGRM